MIRASSAEFYNCPLREVLRHTRKETIARAIYGRRLSASSDDDVFDWKNLYGFRGNCVYDRFEICANRLSATALESIPRDTALGLSERERHRLIVSRLLALESFVFSPTFSSDISMCQNEEEALRQYWREVSVCVTVMYVAMEYLRLDEDGNARESDERPGELRHPTLEYRSNLSIANHAATTSRLVLLHRCLSRLRLPEKSID
ncbi:hypothetical protein CYMTET_2683 [Cymbomonas tetramitiformis]|uniref:Uncharacterized protein n=1 Tax=Cymbomonas tetramitiformis TaxID=36881 RepID=A0AAE0H4R4_9CHLO|nr:hypothetical protein CYMTET_2683 [Cymbomonas tetramitiformis]